MGLSHIWIKGLLSDPRFLRVLTVHILSDRWNTMSWNNSMWVGMVERHLSHWREKVVCLLWVGVRSIIRVGMSTCPDGLSSPPTSFTALLPK